jgi:acyl-homoserine lactone acylase PvdQ
MITGPELLKDFLCPICFSPMKRSEYLMQVLGDNPKMEWLANAITHYRHYHITSWNKCWGRHGNSYRKKWFKNYEDEKKRVNERAKRQIIRKAFRELYQLGITADDFKSMKNTDEDTLRVAMKFLNPINQPKLL